MHTSLCLCGRHSLHAVYARLILQCAVNIVAAHGEVNLLISAYGTLADACHGEVPSLGVAITLVHGKEVAGKEGSLVATCSSTYFHLHVLSVFRILRHECHLYLLFNLRLQFFVALQFFACHLLQVGVALVCENVLRLLYGVEAVYVTLACVHNVAEVFVFFCQLYIALLISNNVWVCDECRHFLVSALKPVKLL